MSSSGSMMPRVKQKMNLSVYFSSAGAVFHGHYQAIYCFFVGLFFSLGRLLPVVGVSGGGLT